MPDDTTPKPPSEAKAPSFSVPPPPSNPKTKSAKKSGRKKNLTKDIQGTIAAIGTGVFMLNPTDGAAILEGSERLAKALNDVAKENDAIYNALMAMNQTTKWGELGVAVSAIALPIMVNHGVIPPMPILGGMMPDVEKHAEDIGVPVQKVGDSEGKADHIPSEMAS